MKRVMVNFTDEQWQIIEKLKGILGSSDSEIVRNIVLLWLSEKSYLTTSPLPTQKGKKKKRK